ncbi:MAG: hypothetical protein ABR599_13180 [Gemmatimonadota bacterium]
MSLHAPLPGVLTLGLLLLAWPRAALPAQTLTIPEYRELVLANEAKLTGIERDLGAANARLDRLVLEKEAEGSPVGARSRELSAEIVKASRRVSDLERQKRGAQADLRTLRSALNARYTTVIDGNLQRLGGMRQGDAGYAELLVETGRYIGARDTLRLQIRIEESVRDFREFPILATDGPAEIREKAGFYRDYVRDVAAKIQAIEREIDDIRERELVGRRMQELLEDLAFQGEAVPDRPGGEAGDIREEPAGGGIETLEMLARSAERRIGDLEEERRQLELLRRRFQAKVRDYDERARTIYDRRTRESGGSSR